MKDGHQVKPPADKTAADSELSFSGPAADHVFRHLADSALVGVYIHQDDRYIYVNQRLAQIFGFGSPQELLGTSPWELVYRADLALVRGRSDRRLTGRPVKDHYRYRGRKRDGSQVWLEVHATTVEYNGRPANMGHILDVSDQLSAEDSLRFAYTELDQLFDTVESAMCVIAPDHTVLRINQAFERLFGVSRGEIIGRECNKVWRGTRCDTEHCPLAVVLAGKPSLQYETTRSRPDDSAVNLIVSAKPLRDPEGGLAGVVESFIDITAIKRSEARIAYLAYHDALTDLPNRALFNDRLTVALAHASRAGKGLALLFLDLDNFKDINDSLGHAVGDEVLKAVAQRLTRWVRSEDTVARFGGDEFILLLQGAEEPDYSVQAARRIQDSLAHPFQVGSHELYVSASIGITIFPRDGRDLDTLVSNADMAMYRAKEEGRNACRLFTPAMNRREMDRLALENELRHALENQEFELHYQPKLEVESYRVVGLEALLRWRRPGRGLVGPNDFIPVAEESGLIVPVGQWVLRQACQAAVSWQQQDWGPLTVAVNLSPRQFAQPDLVSMINKILRETGLEPRMLELEITENAVMRNVEDTSQTLKQLDRLGIRLALDDFGRGYSSLYYLKRFPMHSLKIDRSFVRDIVRDPDYAAIVKTIISMSRILGLRVVAEGVETREQLEFLRRHRCDLMQGFLFSQPMPLERIGALLAKKQSL